MNPIRPLGLQLYSIRDAMERNLEQALTAVADMGIQEVELAGFFGRSPTEFRALLESRNLQPVSMHAGFDFDNLEASASRILDDAVTVGCQYVVVPWVDKKRWNGRWSELHRHLVWIREESRRRNLELLYHHHDFEWAPERVIDALIGDDIGIEIDTYWVAFAGYDPAEEVVRYSDRSPCLHLKDGKLGGTPHFTPLGQGDLDLKAILSASKALHIFIEQDHCEGDSLEAIRQSVAWVRGELG